MIIVRKQMEGLSERALARFTSRARRAAGIRGEVNVVLSSSAELRHLNRCFRGLDSPTDVLSFPPASGAADRFAGDIIISTDIARQNARRLGHAAVDEVKILVLHGVLHLAGYDHERDNGGMARKEAHLRRELRLPESLTERVGLGLRPEGEAKASVGPGLRPGQGGSKTRRYGGRRKP